MHYHSTDHTVHTTGINCLVNTKPTRYTCNRNKNNIVEQPKIFIEIAMNICIIISFGIFSTFLQLSERLALKRDRANQNIAESFNCFTLGIATHIKLNRTSWISLVVLVITSRCVINMHCSYGRLLCGLVRFYCCSIHWWLWREWEVDW